MPQQVSLTFLKFWRYKISSVSFIQPRICVKVKLCAKDSEESLESVPDRSVGERRCVETDRETARNNNASGHNSHCGREERKKKEMYRGS